MDRPKSLSRRRVLAAGTAGIVGAALPIAGQNADQAARPSNRFHMIPTAQRSPLEGKVPRAQRRRPRKEEQ